GGPRLAPALATSAPRPTYGDGQGGRGPLAAPDRGADLIRDLAGRHRTAVEPGPAVQVAVVPRLDDGKLGERLQLAELLDLLAVLLGVDEGQPLACADLRQRSDRAGREAVVGAGPGPGVAQPD